MESWREQNKEHMRIINRFSEISDGKMLSVDKSRNELFNRSTFGSKGPGSLNYTLRRD
jgi:hypothetical protein